MDNKITKEDYAKFEENRKQWRHMFKQILINPIETIDGKRVIMIKAYEYSNG